MNLFSQYKGLGRENYILFLGRIVTNLDSMIWPVLTMILSQKLGLNATEVALVTIGSGIMFLPAGLIGGKLADKYNKKNIIIICDFISVFFYIVCAFIPLTLGSVAILLFAAACQSVENPAYNALIADITKTSDRERAYSLSYLGANLGLVASPTIAGLLFKDFLWLSFLLSGIAIGTSTVLIFFFVRNITPVAEENASYQESKDTESLLSILKKNKVLLLFVLISAIYAACYQQYGYLMPLDIGAIHGEDGAVIFGSVSSLNCIVVVIFTPIFTNLFSKFSLTKKNLIGETFLLIGYAVFLMMLGFIPAYYVAIVLFSFGEILTTIAMGPYLTERIPASHRGRIIGLLTVVQSVLQGVSLFSVGLIYDNFGSVVAWVTVISVLALSIVGAIVLIFADKKSYPKLYE